MILMKNEYDFMQMVNDGYTEETISEQLNLTEEEYKTIYDNLKEQKLI